MTFSRRHGAPGTAGSNAQVSKRIELVAAAEGLRPHIRPHPQRMRIRLAKGDAHHIVLDARARHAQRGWRHAPSPHPA
eukprot:scaffold19798_cov146-Isochrysis_galbana.AAC.2